MTVPDGVVEGLARDFRIGRELGRGATAVVVLATPREPPGAPAVVVKVLLRALDDAPLRSRFRRELAALSRLEHPGVVRCLGGGEVAGHPYLVSEYHEGVRSLEEVLTEGAMVPERAAVMAAGVADALAACHAAGFVHRDVKPANVLVRPDDRPLLIDFGLVAGEFLGATRTATGVILGTPVYMAPELLNGTPASPASDRYALGCLLLEMLTGRPAFEGELGAYLASKSRPYPQARLRGLPRGLGALVAALLDPDPAARPGEELGARLREQATRRLRPAGVTQERGASRAVVPVKAPGRPRRMVPGTVAGLATLLLAVVVGWHVLAPVASVPLERLSFDELGKISKDDVLADLSLPSSCPLPIRGRLYLARHHLDSGRPGAALDLLLPLVREGLPAEVGSPEALLARTLDAATAVGQEGLDRLDDEVLSGIAQARPDSRKVLEARLAALGADDRVRVVLRGVGRAGGADVAPDGLVARLLSAMGGRCPVAVPGEDLPGPQRVTVAAWGAVLTARTAEEGSAALAELDRASQGPGRLPRRLVRAQALSPLVRSVRDRSGMGVVLELISRLRQEDCEFGSGSRRDAEEAAVEGLALRCALATPDGGLTEAARTEAWGHLRDEDLFDAIGVESLLPPERCVAWALEPAWLRLGRPERAWTLLEPFLGDPFSVPPLAERILQRAGLLAGEPSVGEAVRARLRRLRSGETHPERRALLALALAAAHRPPVEGGASVPSSEALEEAGRRVAADPALADLPRLRGLPPGALGVLAWALGAGAHGTAEESSVGRAVAGVAATVGSLEGFSLEERWFLLLHGRGESPYGAWSPFAPAVRASSASSSPEDAFLAVTATLRERGGLGPWLDAVVGLDADVPDERQAVVDVALVDWALLGSANELRELVPDAAARPPLMARVLVTALARWPRPPVWRVPMMVRLVRTAEEVNQEEEVLLRGAALDAAARVAGRPLDSLVSEGFERVLDETVTGAVAPETIIWAADWFASRGWPQRAEGLLRGRAPEALPRYLRWRWHLVLATTVAQVPGRVGEARELLARARLLPWAVEDLIRNESVRILTVRHLQATDGPRGR